MGAGSPMAIVVIVVNTRVLLQFFPLSLPFCPFFFHLVIFCTHKRIPTGAWYVTLHINTGRREVNIRQFGSGKLFLSCTFGQFGEAGKWCLVCDPAHENQTKRSQHTPVWLKEMVFLMYIC